MQISSLFDSSPVTSSLSQQTSESTSSFAGYFLDSSGSSTGSSSSTSDGDQVDNAVQEFLDYAHETPEQRLFSNWLGSEGISEQDYKAMSPAQQQALHNKFAQQLQDKMKDSTLASLNVAIAATLSSSETTLGTSGSSLGATASTKATLLN
jgi:hypothetical protein